MNQAQFEPVGTVHPFAVTVQGSSTAFVQKVQAGRHCFLTDEPAAAGGEDTGPSPYDLLLAALGSCTSMTISLYARRKRWPLEGVTVRLRHLRQKPMNDEAEVDVIEREIVLHGVLSDQQRARMLEIANRCPVHRTLSAQVEIRTQSVPQ